MIKMSKNYTMRTNPPSYPYHWRKGAHCIPSFSASLMRLRSTRYYVALHATAPVRPSPPSRNTAVSSYTGSPRACFGVCTQEQP